jgi:hypothetical protein
VLLDELKPGLRVEGLIPGVVTTVIAAQWHGLDALELTYKTAVGSLGQQVVFRKDEATLSVAQTGSRAFDASASDFNLVADAQQYPYMPRLRDRQVLNEGIVDLPMIWQTDAFGLATGYDDQTQRYIGLWTPDDKGAASAATDSLLLVRPDVASKQRELETTTSPSDLATDSEVDAEQTQPKVDLQSVDERKLRIRFFGVKTLNSDKIELDFKNVADEILANLRDAKTDFVVKIEIEATKASGFEDTQVRTVWENARTLKFDQSGFEEARGELDAT